MKDCKTKFRNGTLSILKDKSGSILPITAVAMVVLAGMVGGGVDMSRAYMVQNRLQNACDAGVLAGRRAVGADGFTQAVQNRANTFFTTNFDEANEGVSGTNFITSSVDDGDTIDGTASTNLNTVIVRMFGFDTLNLSVACSASMSVGNSDVVMVLDATGSMRSNIEPGKTRLQALQDAMKDFYDTVSSATAGGNARVRYGFVPYSQAVNVGQLVYDEDPDYIADVHTIQSREPQYVDVEVDTFQGWGPPYNTTESGYSSREYGNWYDHSGTWRRNYQCNNARPNSPAWSNSGSATTTTNGPFTNSQGQQITETVTRQRQVQRVYGCYRQSRRRYRIAYNDTFRFETTTVRSIRDPIYTTETISEFDGFKYKAVQYDTSIYKTFAPVTTKTGDGGADQTTSWSGCIVERQTKPAATFSFSALTGMNPSDAYDVNIDMIPTSDNATKWKPMWQGIQYFRTDSNGNRSNATVSDYGDPPFHSHCPARAQLLSTMTKTAFDNYADSLTANGNTYHSIGMIWGARLSSPDGIFASNVTEAPSNGGDVARHIIFMTDGYMSTHSRVQTSYGIEWSDRRVTDNGVSNNNARHTQRFLAVCEATKAKGIRLWVIAFGTALSSELQQCASDESAFLANNASQLNETFQEIAKDVGELRVVQ